MWGMLGSKSSKDDGLVMSSSQESGTNRQQLPPEEPSEAVGPPPTANAYVHASSDSVVVAAPKPTAPPVSPPKFQIFQPKPVEQEQPQQEEENEEPPPQEQSFSTIETPPQIEKQNRSWEWNIQPVEMQQQSLVETSSLQRIQQEAEQHQQQDEVQIQAVPPPPSPDRTINVLQDAKFHSPGRLERFQFLNETQVALPKLEEQSVKRRHEFQQHLYELEVQMAGMAARLAQEGMDREAALRGFHASHVCEPLERLVERVGMDNHAHQDTILNLNSRVQKLETDMLQHQHVTLPDARHLQLDVLQDTLVQKVQPEIRLEASKADKREGSLVRKFESIAGTVARRYHEEAASQKASFAILESQLQNLEQIDEVNANDFIETIKSLRLQLHTERQERKARDKDVLQEIHTSTVAMKRALLEAAGDD